MKPKRKIIYYITRFDSDYWFTPKLGWFIPQEKEKYDYTTHARAYTFKRAKEIGDRLRNLDPTCEIIIVRRWLHRGKRWAIEFYIPIKKCQEKTNQIL
jgi:hypothetical protein